MLSASWWAITGGAAVFLGSLLPWISVYVFDGNWLSASNDPNLYKAVKVGDSISGDARAAAAVFGLILIGLAIAIRSVSTRGVLVKPQAYSYGIPLIALSVLGMVGYGIFAVAGYLGFREANGLGVVGYGVFTLREQHPILGPDGTAGSAHVSFAPNAGLVMILLGCTAAVIGAIRSLPAASPRDLPIRHNPGQQLTEQLDRQPSHDLEDRPAVATFANRDRRAFAAFVVLGGAGFAVYLPSDKAHWWQWAKHIPTPAPAVAAYLAGVAVASAWLFYRAFRLGARFDDRGITVRRLLKTDRYAWPEVSRFADGWVSGDQGTKPWALRVVLGDGRAVTVAATSAERSANLAVIRRIAARYQIPADLTGTPRKKDGAPAAKSMYPDPGGKPGSRFWNGREWSPFLWPDPVSGKEAGKPAGVWSPLPGSEQQWRNAAARAGQAGIWSAVGLAVMVVALALVVAGLRLPDGTMIGIFAAVTLAGFMLAVNRWQVRKQYLEISRVGKAAGPAVTEDNVVSPHDPGHDAA